jgi:phytoene synthase
MTNSTEISNRKTIRKGSRSFAAAARLLSPDIRQDVYRLYAWCRHCDDEIDGQQLGFGQHQLTRVDQQQRLARIDALTRTALRNEPTANSTFEGLQKVVQQYQIPDRHPLELIKGFAMDVEGYRYENLEDTLLYCYHVAGVVGIMMAYVMGVRDERVLKRAADLGIAFQLTNISRDVMDDAANNRLYIPQKWLMQEGVPHQGVSNPQYRDGVFRCVSRLLAEADRYYASAREGISELPLRCAWAITAADRVYRNIGEIVKSRGSHAWDKRAVTPASRKIYWIISSGFTAFREVKFRRAGIMNKREPDLWAKPDVPKSNMVSGGSALTA